MKAVVFHGVGEVRLDDVAEPKLKESTDAVVRLTASAICGTDLHLVRGTVTGSNLTLTMGNCHDRRYLLRAVADRPGVREGPAAAGRPVPRLSAPTRRCGDRLMSPDDSPEIRSLRCARCGTELLRGRGKFYLVEIRAVADPSPPVFSEDDLALDTESAIRDLLKRLRSLSEDQLMEEVYLRRLACLCAPCYQRWREQPFGQCDPEQSSR